ncbi:hypothetical protein BCR32DRAFT_277156 [Anaeromyces robustus]|uniref:PPM-type phosphatase domain-containing protein n=1 Tax=Anaeromyces robustus TaxID=1754192 RepID=A0A1Y1XFC7_9FUNG|nr:hypothetical protein BCR32DRAFT_277156 [Anaeromyces robustus]|eukprot:ORX84459.1 hypothetical protein BCR32DRAFT_277156 [Anaeromyces robustus]
MAKIIKKNIFVYLNLLIPLHFFVLLLMNFRPQHKLKASGLKRQPDVVAVLNCDLKLFVLASDGVIKFYNTFKNKYNDIIIKNHDNLKNMARILMEYMSFLGDDRSVVCCHY